MESDKVRSYLIFEQKIHQSINLSIYLSIYLFALAADAWYQSHS